MAVGRISGPLLKRNLVRDGVELTVRNTISDPDVLYIDVVNGRIGVNTNSPTQDLDVNGTTNTTVLTAGKATVDDVEIDNGTIRTITGDLTLEGATALDLVSIPRASIPDIQGDVEITGNLHATGNITADGTITLGDADTDNVVFNADINSNIIPNTPDTFTLGNSTQRWAEGHFADLFVDGLAINTGGGSVPLLSDEVNKIYVHLGGDDTAGNGENVAAAFRTLKHALSQAVPGDTIVLSPGVYEEEFPLVVPTAVTVAGSGIRATTIKPTPATQDLDAFLLNGDTTVTDLTIKDVFYNAVNDTGYAFQYVDGTTINSRSPYIKDVSVINLGSSPNPTTDPFGFASGDAGRGIRVDGARVTSSSIEPAMLFDSITLIVPNSVGLELTNGARVEWLNSFIYFADIGIDAYIGTEGVSSLGKTYLTLDGIQGTIQAGDTLTYYDLDGTTVIATDTVDSVNGNIVVIDGRSDDWIESEDRPTKVVSTNGDAQLSNTQAQFGSTSLQLDGTGDFLNILENEDFKFSTNDFTIEFWIWKTDLAGTEGILDFRPGAGSVDAPLIAAVNNTLIYYVAGASRMSANLVGLDQQWVHIAISRSGTTTRLFVNGTEEDTWVDTTDYISSPLVIGSYYNNTNFYQGYIDEVRISKGVARYTTGFTPSTIAFTGDNATVLLLHFEGTDGSTTIVDDGVTFQDIRSSSGGTATLITRHDRKEFAAEMRSIASANVYGNRGIRADGADIRLRMSSHDFGYIGSGGDFSNNDELVNTANEVIELNGGRVFYSSTDQFGDYRIGDLFYVDQDTGAVTFTGGQFDISSLTGITFTDGTNTTIVNPTQVQTGNLKLSGNTLESLVNGITIRAINNEVTIDSNLSVTGNFDLDGQGTFASVNIEDLTDNRIVIAGTNGEIEDDANFTFDGTTFNVGAAGEFTVDVATGNTNIDGQATIASAAVEDLTTDRIVVVGTNGELEDDANFTWDGTTFAVTGSQTLTGTLDVDTSATIASLNVEDLTSGRVVLAGTSGEIEDSANLTFDGTLLTVTGNATVTGTLNVDTDATIASLVVEDLTDNRIVIAGTGGEIEDDANFRFDGTSFLIGPNLSETFTVEVATGNTVIEGTLNVVGRTTLSSAAVEDLTSGRVVLAGTDGELRDDANLTFDGTLLTITGNQSITGTLDVDTSATIASLNVEDLTDNRIVIAGTSGEIEDDANFTFDGATFNIGATGEFTVDVTTGNTQIKGTLDVDGQSTLASVNVEDLTSGRVVLAGTDGEIEDSANLTFDGTDLTTSSLVISDLTTDRVPFVGAAGAIIDSANLTFNDAILALTGDQTITGTLDVDTSATIASLNVEDLTSGRVVLAGASGEIEDSANLTFDGTTLTVTGDIDVTGNVTIGGNITIGDETTDSITVAADFESDIIPNDDITYDLGSDTKRWNNIYGNALSTVELQGGNIKISSNIIENVVQDEGIIIRPNGSGTIEMDATSAVKLPVGGEGERPITAEEGQIRYNTTSQRVENRNNETWISLATEDDAIAFSIALG